jgi:hypothetical protein
LRDRPVRRAFSPLAPCGRRGQAVLECKERNQFSRRSRRTTPGLFFSVPVRGISDFHLFANCPNGKSVALFMPESKAKLL